MRLISLFVVALVFVGCKKDKPNVDTSSFELKNGVLVLCEGLFQQNNSSVSWIDNSGGINNSIFADRANRSLGDTGNDMKQYGGKVYIVVNNSSTLEVLSAHDFSSIKQIQMVEGSTPKQPRSIAFHGSNAFVSCFDGYVDVIDTASLTITERIQVGANPEGMAVANNKLYVANSGGLNFPNVDSTLSVIDLSTNSEIQKVVVGKNPGTIIADAYGDVYVIARGDYGSIPSRLVRVNTTTDTNEETFPFDISLITAMNNNFLISDGVTISTFDPALEQVSMSNMINLGGVTTLYNIAYNSSNDQIYLFDAMNYTNLGYIRTFTTSGSHITDYHLGLNPSKALFYD